MANLYLDTNIYLDYWFNRNDNLRPLGEFAFNLIKRAISCEFKIFYSELIIDELCNVLSISEKECFEKIFVGLIKSQKLFFVDITNEEIKEAHELHKHKGVPLADATHFITAKDNKLKLITRDNHFTTIGNEIAIFKPEEL